MNFKNEIEKLIQEERNKKIKEKFSGTFLDYLDIVKNDNTICKLSHQRVYDKIIEKGIEILDPDKDPQIRKIFGNKKIKKYNFFDMMYGIEDPLSQITSFFRNASLGGEESKQVLYLVGPVGAGKSTIVSKIKEGLEGTWIYTIDGCPMHEEPLHLIPYSLRSQFEKKLNIKIEGDLCPVCRGRLNDLYNNEFEKVKISMIQLSMANRRGIVEVTPVDPNNQDTSILIGQVDISKIDKYPEDDYRVLSLNGAFNRGNRGIVEFIEIFKNEVEYLHEILTATQEKKVKSPGKNAMIYFDGVIIAHSNEAEWNKFKSELTNEAILDRIVKIEVPYCLEVSEEKKIYEKYLKSTNFNVHVAPYTLDLCSRFSVSSRLFPSNKVQDIITKRKIYNGEEIIEKGETKRITRQELQEDAGPREGMTGLSTRFIFKSISDAVSESENPCIDPIILREIMLRKLTKIETSEENRKLWIELLKDTLYKEFLKELEKEVTKAFVSAYEEQANSLFQNYMDHAEAWVNKTKVKDPISNEELEPDEKFMQSIEEQIGQTGEAAEGMRRDFVGYMFSLSKRGKELNWKAYTPLKEAIENKLLASVQEISRIVTQAKSRSEKDKKKYNEMMKRMLENGWCEYCANRILKFASNHLWRE